MAEGPTFAIATDGRRRERPITESAADALHPSIFRLPVQRRSDLLPDRRRGAAAYFYWKYSQDLPDHAAARELRAAGDDARPRGDGSLIAEYARERRLYLPIQAIPKLVIAAFLSAEDKNFYRHPGIDPEGIVRAVVDQLAQRRPARAGRLDDHPAGRQELPRRQRAELRAQDPRGADRAAHRGDLLEGQDPRALSQRDLSSAR